MTTREKPRTYEVMAGKWSEVGAFALGAMEVAASHPSAEVREFAQQQLDNWVRHGLIEEES